MISSIVLLLTLMGHSMVLISSWNSFEIVQIHFILSITKQFQLLLMGTKTLYDAKQVPQNRILSSTQIARY